MLLKHLGARTHLRGLDDGVLVRRDGLLLLDPLRKPLLVVLERLLEVGKLLAGPLGGHASLLFRGEVLLCLGEEEARGPVPHLAVVERLREGLDLLVAVNDGLLEDPKTEVSGVWDMVRKLAYSRMLR